MNALSPRQAWRNSQIEKFAQRQRHTRKWINFAEVAEFCAREAGSIIPDEGKRAIAFQTIIKDVINKKFEDNGRSQVLFLNCLSKKTRMTRQDLMDIIEYNYDGEGGLSGYLPYCWARRELIERWFEKHRLEKPLGWFEPRECGNGAFLPERLAKILREQFGTKRPAMSVKEINKEVSKHSSVGRFGQSTLERALRIAWPSSHS